MDELSAPDPSVLSTEALARAVQAERDYADGQIAVLLERFRAIDRATQLLNETVNRVPTDVTKEVTHLRELMDEWRSSVGTQFRERDTRSERESRDNKLAVDAAFAAQEKQAVAQNEGNQLAINKSEQATAETIKTNAELTKTVTDGLGKEASDLKDRIIKLESSALTRAETRDQGRLNLGAVFGGIALLISLVGVVVLIVRG